MNAFLKDNIALVAAIVLPLLLAVLFAISTVFVNATTEDPKNDFLVVTNYDSYSTGFQFDVVNDALTVSFKQAEKDSQGNIMPYSGTPRFWRVRMPEMTAEEISLKNPNGNKSTARIEIPGVTDLKIRNIAPGPDGYNFVNSYGGSGGNLMTEIFASGHYDRNDKVGLTKNGRYLAVNIPGADYSYQTRFVGWIVED